MTSIACLKYVANLFWSPKFYPQISFFPHFFLTLKSISGTNNLSSNNWAFQWKISFNLDPLKQAWEVIFTQKTTKASHFKVFLNSVLLSKIFGLIIGFKLTLNSAMAKVNKTIVPTRNFQHDVPRLSLVTIYRVIITPHLDYGDIIFD